MKGSPKEPLTAHFSEAMSRSRLRPAPHNEKGPVTGAFSRSDIGLPQWAGEPSGMRDHTFFLV